MSLDSYKGKRFCSCDECGEELKEANGRSTFTFFNDEFDVFLERIRDEGWESQKQQDGSYRHVCPDCQ